MNCRFCDKELSDVFVSLGSSPLSNSYLVKEQLNRAEAFYPLCVYICSECLLVQLPEFEKPEKIFTDYAYFSSYSDSWLKHSREYAEMMIERFGINEESFVVEIASNDGYLLQYFKEGGIPVLGVEPARNVALAAIEKGIPTEVVFFGAGTAGCLAEDYRKADLLVGNNVLAHVPDLNDFVEGLKILLKADGIITIEFPHLLKLMEGRQFDTIYHEHFSYFSFLVVNNVFSAHDLVIFDVEELYTHGGSLRIYAKHKHDNTKTIFPRVAAVLDKEVNSGLSELKNYSDFREEVKETKRDILSFFIKAKREKKRIVGYGAAAKGNTLLNYCGIRYDFIDYVVDRNPHKQGRYLPGTHIYIDSPERVIETRPDYLFILPWNLKEEIMTQMSYIREWGGKFIVPIPEVRVI